MATNKKSKAKPTWERGYNGHVLWLGKQKLGKVTLLKQGHYEWEAGGRAGTAQDLDQARKAVELAALASINQLDLFGDANGV